METWIIEQTQQAITHMLIERFERRPYSRVAITSAWREDEPRLSVEARDLTEARDLMEARNLMEESEPDPRGRSGKRVPSDGHELAGHRTFADHDDHPGFRDLVRFHDPARALGTGRPRQARCAAPLEQCGITVSLTTATDYEGRGINALLEVVSFLHEADVAAEDIVIVGCAFQAARLERDPAQEQSRCHADFAITLLRD